VHLAIDPDEIGPAERHKLTIGTIAPRPIAWITSLGDDGVVNLAPFSYFMACHSYLPAVAVSIGSRNGVPKDTRANILATGEFVVNMATEELGAQVNRSAAAFPPEISELEVLGLETVPSTKVAPPLLAASPVNLECSVLFALDLGEDPRQSTLFVGQIVMWHIREDLVDDAYRVDQAALHPIARMGGPLYTRADEIFRMDIPDWRDVLEGKE
jgi:flavin reductase (DIM6/NTAB) family NADH-FMN oxidoreductase RutF